ncbi:MAG: glutathione S-transferase N-terminal domain-containing protein [Gammaproteobacteria bacterium]|nr:glutathione S-transferase N-terminal domain-containing protein [Gammaproteobacteria bacterium]
MSIDSLRFRVNLASSSLASALRTGIGINADPAATKPAKLLKLYEFEGCPYCRLVREALTELDLDAMIYPCPKGGKRFRPTVTRLGGKTQFPWLVDPNTGEQMYESMDIIAYLFETYGERPLPVKWRIGALQKFGSSITGIARGMGGVRARPSAPPAKPLQLYSFESSPFARLVRDLLCELEISYVLRSAGRTRVSDWVPPAMRDALNMQSDPDQKNRKALLERAGRVSIPYLVDPNTGTEMAESEDIIRYLTATYAVA